MEDARVRYTKMTIKNSLIELLVEKPISKVSVTELCKQAGINRATFYSHYVDIFDLYKQVEDELIAKVAENLGPILSDECSNTEEVLESFFVFVDENRDICRHFLSNIDDTGFTAKVVGFIEREFTNKWAHSRDIPEKMLKPTIIFCGNRLHRDFERVAQGKCKAEPCAAFPNNYNAYREGNLRYDLKGRPIQIKKRPSSG